jgi:hypothetical protein
VGDWEERKEGDLSSSRCVRLMSDEEVFFSLAKEGRYIFQKKDKIGKLVHELLSKG